MAQVLIDGVKVIKNPRHYDERGWLQEVRRESDILITEDVIGYHSPIKQVYITNAEKNVIKGMHGHLMQEDFMTCIKGRMKLVLLDTRFDSPTFGLHNVFIMSDMNQSIFIPQRVMHGFQGLREGENLMLNVVSKEYNHENPDEYRFNISGKYLSYKNGTVLDYYIDNYDETREVHENSNIKISNLPQSVWEIKNG